MKKMAIICAVAALLVAGCSHLATKQELTEVKTDLGGRITAVVTRQDQTDQDFGGLVQLAKGQDKKFEQVDEDFAGLFQLAKVQEGRLDDHGRRLTAVEVTANESAKIIAGTGLKAMYDNRAGTVLSAQEVEEILREKKYATTTLLQGVQEQLDGVSVVANNGLATANAADAKAETGIANAARAQATADAANSAAAGARSVADGKLGAGDLNSRLTQYAKATEVKLAMAGLSRRFLGYPVQVEEPFKRVSDTDVKTADGKGKPNLGPARDYRWLYTNPGWKIETCVYQWDAPPGAPRWKWVDVIRGGDFLTYSGFNSDGKRVEIRVEAPKTVFPWPDDEDERRAKAALDRVRGGQRVEREYQCPRYPTRCGNPTCTRCKG